MTPEIVGRFFPVLDKGYVGLVDFMGGDLAVERAARVSYGKGTRKVNQTRGLLRYMGSHRHTSPFEMTEFIFYISCPMDCWRQWVRHRTASISEASTRYSEALDYCQETLPGEWRSQSQVNKQGSSEFLDSEIGRELSLAENVLQSQARLTYKARLDAGVAREQARKDLPLSQYTEAFWKIDLHNLLHFLSLRCDSHAQLEIRSYAKVIAGIVKEVCPISFEQWVDYSFCSRRLSRLDLELLNSHLSVIDRLLINDHEVLQTAKAIGMSDREIEELTHKFDRIEQPDFSLNLADSLSAEEIQVKMAAAEVR